MRVVPTNRRIPAVAVRVNGPWLPAILVALLLASGACDDGSGGGGTGTAGAQAPAAVGRPPLTIPSGEPTDDERIAFYIDLLEGGHVIEVQWATLELRRVGAPAVPFLARALEEALEKNTLFAVNLTEVFEDDLSCESILPLITRATLHRDGPLRLAAAKALGASGSPEAAAPLLDLVASGHDRLAGQAILSIERLGAPEGIRGLLGRFPDRINPRAGRRAVLVLAGQLPDPEALSFLHATLSGEHTELSLAAANALLTRDAELHLSAVRARLEEELEGDYREHILDQLAGGRDPELLDSLVDGVGAGNPADAIAAAHRLGNYTDKRARQALWKAVGSKVEALRQQAYHALLASDAPKVAERLAAMLESPDEDDRYDAAYILASAPRDDVVDALIAALDKERDPRVSKQLCTAVALVCGQRGALALAGALERETEPEPSMATLAHTAANALLLVGETPKDAVSALVALAGNGLPSVRMNVARVLGMRCGGPDVAAALEALLSDPSVDVRRMAVESWAALPESTVTPLLKRYEEEEDADLANRVRGVIDQVRNRWLR